MKTPSKLSSLFVAFAVVLCAAPRAAFAQMTVRPAIAPVLPAFSPAAMPAPAQRMPMTTLTPSAVTGAMALVVSAIPSVAAPAPASRARPHSAMTGLASGVARFAKTAEVGAGVQADRQISEAMFNGSADIKDAPSPMLTQEEPRLSQAINEQGIKLPASSTPYDKLAALFRGSKDTVSKRDLIGWHAGRFFSKDAPQDTHHAVIIGVEVGAVKDGGPLFDEKVLKVAFIGMPAGEKAEAMSPKTIDVLKGNLDKFSHTASPSGNKVEYEWTFESESNLRDFTHVEIRRNGRYLILKQDLTTIIDAENSYYQPGTYKNSLYAYFFEDVTPQETATPSAWVEQAEAGARGMHGGKPAK